MKTLARLIALLPLAAFAAGPQVTIYNDGFATVKEERALVLAEGVAEVRVTDMSRQLEPDSVMLVMKRDFIGTIIVIETFFERLDYLRYLPFLLDRLQHHQSDH